ncbi:MAG: response regulator [Elusimicrobia bacterium]|nr:response regulator [Elusimicrobiota bacterium]
METDLPALSIMIVADDDGRRAFLAKRLGAVAGWKVDAEASRADEGLWSKLSGASRDLIFLDERLAGQDTMEVLEKLRQLHPKSAVVVTAAKGDDKLAVGAMKAGAADYLTDAELELADLGRLFRRVIDRRYLVDQNMELRQVNQMKNEFIANVSHELRTPLSVVIGYAETLKDGGLGELSAAQYKAVDSILSRSVQLLETLNRILRLRESHEGKQQLWLKPVELVGFLKLQAGANPRERERKAITVAASLPQEEAWVLADRDKLSEVLSNLLSNAFKFAPEKSTARLSLKIENDRAVVSLQDEGAGIAPEMLPRLFESFSAAIQGPTRRHAGLGLGLPLSKQIIEQHGGRIWLESGAGGRGTTAFFTLPLSGKDTPAQQVEHPALLEKKRILIVEDNPDLIDVLMLFLSHFSQNLELSTAASGFEALDRVKESIPHLIILDVMMPGMDGFEVIARLRKLPATERIPILVLTGYQEAAPRARKLGVEVLLKPFEKGVFMEKLLRLLGAQGAAK